MLQPGEEIEQIIVHKNYLPFRLEDWLRVPIYFLVIGLGIYTLSTEGASIEFFLILPVMIVAIYFGVFKLLTRWLITSQLEYVVTSHRFIIRNKKSDKVLHSFAFTDFPEMTLRENAYNYGFIILGKPAPPIVTTISPLRIRTGFNMIDHDVVIENLPKVRTVYNMLRGKAGRSEKNYT